MVEKQKRSTQMKIESVARYLYRAGYINRKISAVSAAQRILKNNSVKQGNNGVFK